MWPFSKPAKKTIVENIGPDAPRIYVAADITSYSKGSDGNLLMTLNIDNQPLVSVVPSSVLRHYPLGTDIHLLVVKK